MQSSDLRSLLEETGLSAEALGEQIDVSGMTIRRWSKPSLQKTLPPYLIRSLTYGVYKLISSGTLSSSSPLAARLLGQQSSLAFEAALKNLGFSPDKIVEGESGDQQLAFLSEIGSKAEHRAILDSREKDLLDFKSKSTLLNKRISRLLSILKNPLFELIDKLVAYGALFYLLTPIDLIPDYMPLVGLIDDIGVLSIASAHYVARPFKDSK